MSGYFFSLVGGVNAGIGRSELVLGDLESDRTFFSGTSGKGETEGNSRDWGGRGRWDRL